MNKVCIYDIGNCFIFNCKIDDIHRPWSIEEDILDIKASAIIFGDPLHLPFSSGTITILLFHTFSRKAYDLYFRLNGSNMRMLDPFAVQGILGSMGVSNCKTPCIYEFQPIQVIRKEKEA